LNHNWSPGRNGLTGTFSVTRTIRDTAALLDILAGLASGDPYGAHPLEMPDCDAINRDAPKLRVAFTAENWAGVPTSDACRGAGTFTLFRGVFSYADAQILIAPDLDLVSPFTRQ